MDTENSPEKQERNPWQAILSAVVFFITLVLTAESAWAEMAARFGAADGFWAGILEAGMRCAGWLFTAFLASFVFWLAAEPNPPEEGKPEKGRFGFIALFIALCVGWWAGHSKD